MRLAVATLALVMIAASPAAAQRRVDGVGLPRSPLGINGTRQAAGVENRRYVVQPVLVVRNEGWSAELREIDRRIRRARDAGEISRREARSLRQQVRLVRSLDAAYAANGYTASEREALNAQTFALRDLAQAPARPAPLRRGR